jgi:2-(1,2-epoxy-1,2-dihydrophenyl)acetyl-CoA isomerase
MKGPVTYQVADGVAHVELNRPRAANAFDLAMSHALGEAVDAAASDSTVRAVLLTGAGQRFCAGGDVASFAAAQDRPTYILELAHHLDGALQSLAAMPKPAVCAVQGAVAGAGLGVMLSCDLIVAETSTKFAFAYPSVGLTPDCGVSYLLPRAIGSHRALGFALSGRPIIAKTALDWGLVTEVSDDPTARAIELSMRLTAGPSAALGETRRLLRRSWESNRADMGEEEAQTISRMVRSEVAQSLIRDFTAR